MVVVAGGDAGAEDVDSLMVGDEAEVLVLGELGFGAAEIHLKLAELVLEERDDADAAVDGVAQPHVGFVSQRVDGVFALVRLQLVQKLRNVAGAEHFMNVGEFLRLIRREVRGEHALRQAFPPEELACGAGGGGAGRSHHLIFFFFLLTSFTHKNINKLINKGLPLPAAKICSVV